jgi:hypothetical protein
VGVSGVRPGHGRGALGELSLAGPFNEEQLDAALAELAEPGSFADAEAVVAQAAPDLQKVLARALEEGGWFGDSHEAAVLKAATTPDQDDRLTAVRTVLA